VVAPVGETTEDLNRAAKLRVPGEWTRDNSSPAPLSGHQSWGSNEPQSDASVGELQREKGAAPHHLCSETREFLLRDAANTKPLHGSQNFST